MISVVKEKNLKCFEWIVHVGESINIMKSPFFSFNQRKFNLKFEYRYSEWVLYFESDSDFSDSLNVTLDISKPHNEKYYASCTIQNGSQEIWRYRSSLRYSSLTFRIIFMTEILKETKETFTNDASERKKSYLKENIHLLALSRDFSKLLKEDDVTFDVTITCEGKTFHAHKNILQARSTVFTDMLKCNMVDDKAGLITIKDIKLPIFEGFFLYLYSGCLPKLSMDTVKDLYEVGDEYAVEELKKACSEFMIKNLSATNACEILVLADLHSDQNFRKQVISYTVEKDIPRKFNKWSDFCKSHSILAVEILNLYIEKHCK